MYPTLITTPGLATFTEALDTERQAQLAKWGDQQHPDNTGSTFYAKRAEAARRNCQLAADAGMTAWDLVLLEEVYEALAESDPVKLRAELIQTASVIAAWISDLDRRASNGEHPAPPCTAGLLPSTDEAVDRCVRRGKHDTHVTAAGARWPNNEDGA